MIKNILFIQELSINGYTPHILDILSVIAVFIAISVIITKNPIVSVLFLIGLFVIMAGYLMLLGLQFIGLSYLLVYVGAISILFLFILMLINVRVSELLSETRNSLPLVFIISLCFNLPFLKYIPKNSISGNEYYNINSLLGFNNIYSLNTINWDSNIIENSHITSLGNVMYSTHSILLLLVSVILLLAMVGAIVITIKHKDNSNNKLLFVKNFNYKVL